MTFEYDLDKSAKNKRKHGIDFEEAQALWDDDSGAIVAYSERNEVRYLVVGMIEDRHWTAIVTDRDDKIRIISVRRSRKQEVEFYEKNNSH